MNHYSNKKEFGDWGEQIAADYLKNHGYQLVERNFRCYYGEIDLIALEKDVWCFIEVKSRKSSSFGHGYAKIPSPVAGTRSVHRRRDATALSS